MLFRERRIKINYLNSAKAFSLIELMVVVAIIGIIAGIGTIQYSKFQSKTRQSEAKATLTALFIAEVGFFTEWNLYSVDLKNIGFGTSGSRLRYVAGFQYGVGCTNYSVADGAPPEQNTIDYTTSCGVEVNKVSVTQSTAWALPSVTVTLVNDQCTNILNAAFVPVNTTWTSSLCDSTPGAQSFTAVALGDPNAQIGNVFVDGWSINQAKLLLNPDFGIQ